MKKILFTIGLTVILFTGFCQTGNKTVKHIIKATVQPDKSFLTVYDSIIINSTPSEIVFNLNENMKILSHSSNVQINEIASAINSNDVGMDRDDSGAKEKLKSNKWEVKFNKNRGYFSLTYSGTVDSVLQQSKSDYQRGFTESSGIICNKGVYLAGSTFWIPNINDSLSVFELTTNLPIGWKSVSQGKRIISENKGRRHIDKWICNKPQEEIFFIAAKFTEYGYTMNNGVKAMAFLRTPDESLSHKYLEATERYMVMYEKLITKYPYSKFALIENFWETGYGMPSFTLLGEKIIRFPFILYSSYPHELLHNWWGNSVYVDFSKGNWCEGTTAYMADHMMKEQNGKGEEYRRSTLQKFTNFVTPDNDFPLTKFASRYNASSEAIGYGKALMMWHMLRRKVGDDIFRKGMRLFYKNNKFKKASYDDIRKAMETVSHMNLKPFFTQWTTRKGAPELAIKNLSTDVYNNEYRIFLTLEQVQPQDAFVLDIPIGIATQTGKQFPVVHMTKKMQNFQIVLNHRLLKLVVDPQYDVFRKLNPKEVPPALSKALASLNNIIILPAYASKAKIALYRKFVEKWKIANNKNYSVVFDNDMKSFPKDKTVWILGFKNKFSPIIEKQLIQYNTSFGIDSLTLFGKHILLSGKDFIINVSNKKDLNKNIVFLAIDNEKAIPGLIRKLPHYGKYSYLGFEGDEPVNIAKGQWPVLYSPLIKVFDKNAQNIVVKQKRKPLSEK